MPKIHREEKEVTADSPKPVAAQTFKEAWDQYQQTHGSVGDMFAFSKGWQAAQQPIAGQTYAEALTSRAASGKLVDQMDFKAGWHARDAEVASLEARIEAMKAAAKEHMFAGDYSRFLAALGEPKP